MTDYSREYADIDRILPGSRSSQIKGCEVDMGGYECGDLAVATVLGKKVCALHRDSAVGAAEFIANVLGGSADYITGDTP